MNEVSSLLERHGIRPTQQRVKVAEVLLTAPVHLTAEQLLTTLRQSPSRVSKATVYNTLKLFVDHGLVRQIHLDPERCVYDSAIGPHHHFQNVATGEMQDIQPEELDPGAPAGVAARHRSRRRRSGDPGPAAGRLSSASTRGGESL